MQLEGTDLPVWGMEIDPDEAKERFRASSAKDGGKVGGTLNHTGHSFQGIISAEEGARTSEAVCVLHTWMT